LPDRDKRNFLGRIDAKGFAREWSAWEIRDKGGSGI
jgi:hypothetical protein